MEVLAENIERLITIDHVPFERMGERPDRIFKTYENVRKAVSKPPIFVAADRLTKEVKSKDTVIISTGWVIPYFLPRGETDGPIGAVGLARAINIGLNANILFISEESVVPVLEAVCTAAGLRTVLVENVEKLGGIPVAAAQSFPIDKERAQKEAKRLLDNVQPSAVITIEKAGRNERDVWHTGLGNDFSASTAKVDYLVEEAREREILTIGIGDLGNEIGFGVIKNALKELIPFGAKCKCPCGAGIVTKVEADVPVFAACSNWGAYGIEACLSGILQNPEVLHDATTERRMVEAAVRAGCADGITPHPTLTVHGWSVSGHIHLLEVMRGLVRLRLARLRKKYGIELAARP